MDFFLLFKLGAGKRVSSHSEMWGEFFSGKCKKFWVCLITCQACQNVCVPVWFTCQRACLCANRAAWPRAKSVQTSLFYVPYSVPMFEAQRAKRYGNFSNIPLSKCYRKCLKKDCKKIIKMLHYT